MADRPMTAARWVEAIGTLIFAIYFGGPILIGGLVALARLVLG